MVPFVIAIGWAGAAILLVRGLYGLIASAEERAVERNRPMAAPMFSDEVPVIVKRQPAGGIFRSPLRWLHGGQRRKDGASFSLRAWPWRDMVLIGGLLVLAAATFGPWIGLMVVALGSAVPPLLAERRRAHRRRLFLQQFPAALETMSRSLRAGHALIESIRSVAEESPDPIGDEFRSVVCAVQYGVSLPDALKDLAKRVDSSAMKFFVTALVIQRETGGNLVQIIEFISRLTRRQLDWEAKLQALSAEGRFSANVLLALPVGVSLVLLFINPDYLRPLVADSAGRMLLVSGGVLALLGFVVIRRMVKIHV